MTTAPLYNETDVLERIDNQGFYNMNLGPFIAALAFQMFMMGVLTLQTWTYYGTMAAEDTRRNRWLVGTMFFLGAFQTATNFEIMYSTFVSGYGRVLYWDNFQWTLIYEIAWTALIALIAHIFFMHRCFVITRSYAFLVVCGIGAGVAFTAGVASTIGLLRSKYYTRSHMVIPQATTWMVSSAATDVAISAVLIVKLRNTKTSFPSTVCAPSFSRMVHASQPCALFFKNE